MRVAGLLVAIAALLGLGIYAWLNRAAAPAPVAGKHYQPKEVDYRIRGFKAVIFDPAGRASQRLQGKQLAHYPYDNHYEIEQPDGQTLQGAKQWEIHANLATSADDLNELHWQGNVRLYQWGEDPVKVTTQQMRQRPREYTASTQDPVTFNSTGGIIHANGMQLNTLDNYIYLKGDVNGVYQVP